MPSLVTKTREHLSKLASPEEFEALATAVLRAAIPAYASIIHVGTNAAGRAVRSPIDGIDVLAHRGGPHLLLVQHTTTSRRDLRKKWLGDKAGDVTKARAIFEQEIAARRINDATLVLTSTTDPDEMLIRDVHAAVGGGLSVDIWSASRIADFLDRDPEGQWLREQQFGIESIRLSASQARAISSQSVKDYLPLVARGDTVPRAIDVALSEFAQTGRGAGFVIGESGLGKSTALRRLADEWIAQDGIALVLAHELIEQAGTIEQAIALGFRHWAPALDKGCGFSALSLATPKQPLLLIVEDVNRATNPRRIIERLVGWSIPGANSGGEAPASPQWRLLCPVWRGNAGLTDPQLRDRVMGSSFVVDRFRRSEAVEAIRVRAHGTGISLTALQVCDLAMALGDDPLLIGLSRDWSTPNPRDAIRSYLTANIAEAADDRLLAGDLRHALDRLTEQLVEARALFPTWSEIRGWFSTEPDTLAAIRRLIDQARIIHLSAGPGDERLVYRHDRVRDHLLTHAMARLISSNRLTPELWCEPSYAGLIGGTLSALPEAYIVHAAKLNPVALFAALQDARLDDSHRGRVIAVAEEWAQSPAFAAAATEQQRHHAMRFLARTDGAFVADLAKRFPWTYPQLEALVRNGDVRAAAALCARSEPGVNDAWRDRVIAHALSRHSSFVPDLADLIRNGELSPRLLEGALNAAGEVGDSALCDALATRWAQGDQASLSTGWLWAALRCCPPTGHPLADALCVLWGRLPTKEKREPDKHDRNPRWDIAGYTLPWAFSRKPETRAIAYLIDHARNDAKLEHIMSYILSKIDVPSAVVYSVKLAAKISRRTEKSGGFNMFANDLKDTWSPEWRGRALSQQSRSVLEPIWRNRRINRFERKTAFLIWSLTPTREEFAGLATLEADPVLADIALRARLSAGDQSAVPLLRQRIWGTKDGEYWWHYARQVGLTGLREDIQRYFVERRSNHQAESQYSNSDFIVSELIMDSGDEFAKQTIIENWDQLETSPRYVQAALYLATPETVALARSAIAKSPEPGKLFEFIDMHWGIKHSGRKGVTDLCQLQILEPYYAVMGEMRITSFFEAANELGALTWRKKHLDPLVAKLGRGYCTSDRESLFSSLDAEVADNVQTNRTWFAISHWFERREMELRNRKELLGTIGEWAFSRASAPAVALLCEAILLFGERPDLDLLDSLPSDLRESAFDSIANCVYGVQQRSLSTGYQQT